MFYGCTSLSVVTGAIASPVGFSLEHSPKLTRNSLLNIINGLVSVTTPQTLALGSTNLAKLTDDEKKIATGKGWTLT